VIHVERNKVGKPKLFESYEMKEAIKEYKSFHIEGGSRSSQRKNPLFGDKWLSHEMKALAEPLLRKLFCDKCAYTERPEDNESRLVMGWHRPPVDALDFEGNVSPQHYWWLALEWDNWYLISTSLEEARQNYFPVVDERIAIPDFSDLSRNLELDTGILLDPCVDYPEWSLIFDSDGVAHSRVHPSEKELIRIDYVDRGLESINRYRLNDTSLVTGRVHQMEVALKLWQDFKYSGPDSLMYARMLDPAQPYCGAVRQLLARELVAWISAETVSLLQLSDLFEKLSPELSVLVVVEAETIHRALSVNPEIRHQFAKLYDSAGDKYSDFPPNPYTQQHSTVTENVVFKSEAEGVEIAFTPESKLRPTLVLDRTANITRVEIENFKGIHKIKIRLFPEKSLNADDHVSLDGSHPRGQHWKMLLGENGSGKSSVLQAIALALCGEKANALFPDAKDFIRRNSNGRRARRAIIRLHFNTGDELEVKITKKEGVQCEAGWPEIRGFVRAYGATRLLPAKKEQASDLREVQNEYVRVKNLFDPYYPISDVESWLISLDIGDFNVAAITIEKLLHRSIDAQQTRPTRDEPRRLTRDIARNEIYIDGDRFSDASDGYRSVLALVCDIMAGLATGYSSMLSATGIVLIDEIGAHLHPRWKMSLVKVLRQEFPNLQVIASTHDPLCLRGLMKQEVDLVQLSQKDGVFLQTTERNPSDLRVDQLLTSEFFGLHTAVDPDIDQYYQAYYRILAKPEGSRSKEESKKLEDLKRIIDRQPRILGYTRRDQLIYEAIDTLLAEDLALSGTGEDPARREKRKKKTMKTVQKMWSLANLQIELKQRND